MADFNDMSGWREELRAWRSSKEYQRTKREYFSKSSEVIPLSEVLRFVELLLKNTDCLDAYKVIDEWKAKFQDRRSPEAQEQYPHEAIQTLSDFKYWYLFKRKFPESVHVFREARFLADEVRNGEVPDVRSSQALEYLSSQGVERFIDFDK